MIAITTCNWKEIFAKMFVSPIHPENVQELYNWDFLSIFSANLLNNQNYSCRLKRGSYMEFLSPIHYPIKLEHRTNGNGDSHFH